MANTILLTNGRIETVFKERDFLDLVVEYMGSDAREWLEEHLAEKDGDADIVSYAQQNGALILVPFFLLDDFIAGIR